MISSPTQAPFSAMRKPPLLLVAATAVVAIYAAVQDRPHDYALPPHLPRFSRLPVDAQAGIAVRDAPARVVLPVSIPTERPAQTHDLANPLDPIISEASQRFAIPEEWIRRVIRIESGGRTIAMGQPLTSSTGAIGVMQLMAKTYNDMRLRHGLGSDPSDVRNNILAGTAYLREMYERYGYPGLFAAYNAGPARLEKYLRSRRTPALGDNRVSATRDSRQARISQFRLTGGWGVICPPGDRSVCPPVLQLPLLALHADGCGPRPVTAELVPR